MNRLTFRDIPKIRKQYNAFLIFSILAFTIVIASFITSFLMMFETVSICLCMVCIALGSIVIFHSYKVCNKFKNASYIECTLYQENGQWMYKYQRNNKEYCLQYIYENDRELSIGDIIYIVEDKDNRVVEIIDKSTLN